MYTRTSEASRASDSGLGGSDLHVDHLGLAPPQGRQVTGELQRIANARAVVEATASDGGEPFHRARLQIEQVDDGARDTEQISKSREGGLGDRHRRFPSDEGEIDLVQEVQPFVGGGQRGRGPTLVAKREPAQPGQRRGEDDGDGGGGEDQCARPLQDHVLRAVHDDTPAEGGHPARGGEAHLTVDGILQLGHTVVTLEQAPNHRNVDIVREVIRAGPGAVKDELTLAVDDEQVATGNLDRRQPRPERVQVLHGGDDPDDLAVNVADRHGQGHRRLPLVRRLVDLRHVRLPGPAHPSVPVTKGVALAVVLRRFRLARPDGPGGIGEEDAVDIGEALMQLTQVSQRFHPVPPLDALAEAEASSIGAQDVEVPLFARLDRGGDATRDGVVLSQVLLLFDADRPGEEERSGHEDDQQEGGDDPVERRRAAKTLHRIRGHSPWNHGDLAPTTLENFYSRSDDSCQLLGTHLTDTEVRVPRTPVFFAVGLGGQKRGLAERG